MAFLAALDWPIRIVLGVGLLFAGVLLRGTPRADAAGTIATAVDAAIGHACAITAEGGVKCWGSDWLGDGSRGVSTVPVDVCGDYDEPAEECRALLQGVTGVSAALQHTCAVLADGTAKCWGYNFWGQLGTEDLVTCPVTKLIPLSAAGASGQGSPATDIGPCSTTPVDVTGLNDAVAITTGSAHSCAVTASGRVKCWGANYLGQLGDGEGGTLLDFSRTPVEVCAAYDRDAGQCLQPLDGVVAIASPADFACALTETGTVKCWGWTTSAWLGAPTNELCEDEFGRLVPCSTTALDVPGLEGVTQFALGLSVMCVLAGNAGVRCGGGNGLGTIGDAGACGIVCLTPVDVPGLTSGVAALAGGDTHMCALTDAGGLRCWGTNQTGELGAVTTELCGTFGNIPCSRSPVAVTGLASGVAAASGGRFFTCALLQGGSIKCWGDNCCGQLGSGQRDPPGAILPHAVPVNVAGLGPKLPGDADCQNGVTSIDALFMLQYAAGLSETLLCQFNADMNRDGAITSLDAALVLQIVAGVVTFELHLE